MSPKPFRVARSVEIDAPPALVHALVDDFREWSRWSPWEDADPAMARTYAGADRGVGASYAWSGDRKAGSGEMRIVDSETPSAVGIDLRFDKPFPSRNRVDFTIEAVEGGRSRVTWAMTGETSGMARVVGLVVPMDRLVGPDFERGLARLKELAERRATA